jgi:ATP-dependent Lon protease, bacterial type
MEGTPVLEVVESPLDIEDAIRANEPLPDALPVLPLREMVTFPETFTPLAVGQERSIKLVNDVLGANRMLAMVASHDPENEEPGPADLYDVGVVGVVARMLKVPDGTIRILVQGAQGSGSAPTSPRSRIWWRGSPSCPTWSSPAPSWRR